MNQLRETQEETQKTVATLRKEVSVVKKEKLALEKYRNRMLRKNKLNQNVTKGKNGGRKNNDFLFWIVPSFVQPLTTLCIQ